MERFVKGDVVVIPFPFSDLSQAKKRPAMVVTRLEGQDVILCQITSQDVQDQYAIPIEKNDFQEGSFKQTSNIRPNRLFTADSSIVLYKVGHLKNEKIQQIVDRIIVIIKNSD